MFSCHIRHINPTKIYPERIMQKDREIADDLNYDGTEFLVPKKKLVELKLKTIYALMLFVMKIN